MYSIYQFYNKITKERYIGYAINAKNRFSSHCHADTPLGRAIQKYSIENFEYSILHETDSLIEAKDIEKYYIRFFDSVTYGYNQIYASSGPSELGKLRIAKARKNTVVVKDIKTNKIIGSVSTNHPKVLSGEWVHHTSGLTHVIDPITNKRKWVNKDDAKNYKKWEADTKGSKNGKYSGITRTDLIKAFLAYAAYIETIADDKNIFSARHFTKLLKERNSKYPTIPNGIKKFRFPELGDKTYGDLGFMIDNFLSKNHKENFRKYLRGKTLAHRKKISITNIEKNRRKKYGN